MANTDVFQGLLFDECSTKCEAYTACGGYRLTAPCGCAWLDPEIRYQCHKCYLICRERGSRETNRQPLLKDFVTAISSGYSLDQLSITQDYYDLPVYIPCYTNKYQGNYRFPKWVAVDIRMLFNCRNKRSAVLKSHFATEHSARQYLNASPDCQLMAVFNGTDKMLESVWAMNRKNMLEQLATIGFSICTAPTFSITALTTEGMPVPFSHHTAMFMRHHRVLSEIDDVGLCGAPNLYWLDGDKRDINRWSDWLKENAHIYLVSRDFTSTRRWSAIEPKLSELVKLLQQAGRFFHVLIIGTGHSNGSKVVERLSKAGHKVTVITAAPIHKAMHGSKYFINDKGKLSDASSDSLEYSIPSLMIHNVEIFEKDLEKSVVKPF